MSHGRALRDIRKIKGMTQNDIVTKNLTRSSIAKIETDNMIPEKEKIIYEFRSLKLSTYDNPIIKLLEKIDLYLENYKDIQIIELKAVLEASQIFKLTDDVELAREKVDFIWERLEKQDEWFYFDVLLLSNIIYVFDSEIIVDVGIKIMKEIEKFSYNVQSKRLKISIVLNLGLFLKIADKMDLAIEFIEMGIELAKQNEDLVVEYLAHYRKSEFLLYKGHFKEAEKLYNKSVQFYEFIGNQIMLKDIKNDWLNYNNKFYML